MEAIETKESLEEQLKSIFGFNGFRPSQKDIISAVLAGQDVLAILPTGAGKSLTYQFPAMIMPGISIIVSPLISLMQDQVVSLNKNGLPAAFLNSSLPMSEMSQLMAELDRYKILFIAPERLSDPRFIERLKEVKVSFFAVDEAHCISQWGHSFRPEYRQMNILKEMFPESSVLALTATATPEVERDIATQLAMKSPKLVKSSFDRPNLTIRINQKITSEHQLNEFLQKHKDDSGIIYCGTRKKVDATYEWLLASGYEVGRYHAGMSDADRAKVQHSFIYDDVKLLVATVAFGMGIHKPDIRFIVHLDMPKSIEQYYQEIGRAGRDGMPSECLMLYGGEDLMLYQYFTQQIEDLEERENSEKKVRQMYSMCSSISCRRNSLLNYFGEKYPSANCKSCDNCLDDVELIDGTEIAQKILSCVYRAQERFGSKVIIEILRGSRSQKIMNRQLDRLSTYKIMAEYSEEELRYYIQCLVEMGYLKRSEGEYPLLQWTERTRDVVFAGEPVKFRKRTFRAKKPPASDLQYDQTLFQELRAVRMEISQKEGIPPYAVFTDRSHSEMAMYYPQNRDEMLAINGVGKLKWELYGLRYLEVIKEYCEKNQIRRESPSVSLHVEPQKRMRMATHEVSYGLFQEGKSVEQIAKQRGFTEGTIIAHLVEMIREGGEVDLNRLVASEKQEQIRKVIEEVGGDLMKPFKEKLPEEITYDEIRFVWAHNLLDSGRTV